MATISCQSERYLGVPLQLEISAHSSDLTGNDWIGVYDESDKRQAWDWLRGVSGRTHTHTFKNVVVDNNLQRDGRGFALPLRLRAKFFRNGGWFSNGTLAGELDISLANPLEAVTAQVRGDSVVIDYTVKAGAALPGSLFTLTTDDDVRVGRASMVSGSRSGRVEIPVPRVGGVYHCNCLFHADGSTALWRGQVRVTSNGVADIFLSRSATNVMRNGLGSATVVRPGDTLFLRVAPPRAEYLTVDDMVYITGADAANIDGCPKARAFQVPLEKLPLRPDGTCRVVLRKPGVYYASLALKHPGAFLPAGTATIIVTERAPVARGAEASDEEPDAVTSPPRRQRGPEIMSTRRVEDVSRAGDGGHLCVVCCDRAVAQMVRPCNHVCLCARCDSEMRARNQMTRCPVCRGSVDSTERVFF